MHESDPRGRALRGPEARVRVDAVAFEAPKEVRGIRVESDVLPDFVGAANQLVLGRPTILARGIVERC